MRRHFENAPISIPVTSEEFNLLFTDMDTYDNVLKNAEKRYNALKKIREMYDYVESNILAYKMVQHNKE